MTDDNRVVIADKPAPNVMRLLINRPGKRNAIDHAVREGILNGLREAAASSECRAIVFGGVEGVFSAGGDLPSMGGLDEAQARSRMRHIHLVCRTASNSGLPIVSAFEGVTAGAAVGLGLLGDAIVMGKTSKILFPFMKLGLTPDWGTLHTLPRRVGMPRALQILASARPIGAADALAIGLVDQVVDDDQVMSVAVDRAREFATLPSTAFSRMKLRLNEPVSTLDEELRREEHDQVCCLTGSEFREGYDAFSDKRDANFCGVRRIPGLWGR